MRTMFLKSIKVLVLLQLLAVVGLAQETFDQVTFTAPEGWQRSADGDAVQFTKQKGGELAILMLFRSLPTSKDPKETFDASWKSLVKGLLTKVDAPTMQPTVDKSGWTIESGAAVGEKDGDRVVAMLLSATGGRKVVNLLLLTNGESFQTEIERFISSIDLERVPLQTSAGRRSSSTANSGGTMESASRASNSLDARYSCLKMAWRSGATMFDPAGLGFTISGSSYSVVGGTGGRVSRNGEDIIFSGGRLNGYRGEMRSYSDKTYILFRVDFTQVRRGESGRMGDLQCYRQ